MDKVEIQISPKSLKELVVDGVIYRSAFDFRLTEAELVKARKELKETEEVRESSLRELKELLLGKASLEALIVGDEEVRYRTDDDYLLRYLRHKKFKVKDTYKFIQNFYKFRKEFPELFLVSSHLETMLDSQFFNLMPYTDEDGHIIIIFKMAYWNTAGNFLEALKYLNNIIHIFTMNPRIQVNGFKEIWDFSGVGASLYTTALQPSYIRLWTRMSQELYPWKIKRVVLFNCGALLYAAFATVRLFFKKKIVDRVALLRSDLSQLPQYINPTVLPKEYGGKLEDSECYSYLKQPIMDNLRYFNYEQSFGYKPNL